MKFEYLILVATVLGVVISVNGEWEIGKVAEYTNKLGEEGWKAVGMVIFRDKDSNQRIQYLFMREKQ